MGIDVGSTASKCIILKDGKEIVAKADISVGTGTSGPARAMKEALEVLLKEGSQKSLMDKMMTRKEQYEIINYYFYENLDKQLAKDL